MTLIITGVFTAPVIMNYVRETYISLQIDVNMRQAQSMSRVLRNLLDRGESNEMVISDLQASVEGSQLDRGYLCMIDRKDGELLCHPDPTLVGKPIAPFNQKFSDILMPSMGESPWIDRIKSGSNTGGLIIYPDGTVEIDYFTPVEGTDWIISSHENTGRVEGEISMIQTTVMSGFALLGLIIAFPASWAARRVSRKYEKTIVKEQERSENLLLNILPLPIAERLKNSETTIVDSYKSVTVIFSDIVGFTELTRHSDPEKVLELLNRLFTAFDKLAQKYGLEKIKTIGDAWMAASGLPLAENHNPQGVAKLAIEMQGYIKSHFPGISVRIGIHTGPVAAGVVGKTKFAYDLWGETVNRASRLESTCETGGIHVSSEFLEAAGNKFIFRERGLVELKGLGNHSTWYLTGHSGSK